jgi:hypothetical protein
VNTVYLVSCVSDKQASELPAEHLYCSAWFQKARRYVLRQMKPGDEWHILSAKHGLLHPGTSVGPYNETLNNMRKSERLDWSQRVINERLAVNNRPSRHQSKRRVDRNSSQAPALVRNVPSTGKTSLGIRRRGNHSPVRRRTGRRDDRKIGWKCCHAWIRNDLP